MEPLRGAWRRQREAARRPAHRRGSTRKQYREFVDDYLDFTESPGAGEVPTPMGQPSLVRDTAGSRILAAYEHVRAYETIITWADVPTLHALRIDAKRLRYTLESFREVLPGQLAAAHRRRHGAAGPPRPAQRRGRRGHASRAPG